MTLAKAPIIPRAAGSLPLLGHAVHLWRDNLAFIASLRKDYGPLVEITLQPGTRTIVVQAPSSSRPCSPNWGRVWTRGGSTRRWVSWWVRR